MDKFLISHDRKCVLLANLTFLLAEDLSQRNLEIAVFMIKEPQPTYDFTLKAVAHHTNLYFNGRPMMYLECIHICMKSTSEQIYKSLQA